MTSHPMPPRMKPIAPRKSVTMCVLDIGTSKIVALIARLTPMETSQVLPGRTHRCRILGIGHQRSRGIKAGLVVDMEGAEQAIRQAIDAAERMAGVEVASVIVNVTGGRIASQLYGAKVAVGGRPVADADIHRVLEAATATKARQGHAVLHSLPTGCSLDGLRGIKDPRGMVGEELGADMHVVSCEAAAVRNLMLAVERCHLKIDAMVATPYASGLSSLVDDEAELGAAVIDLGGGTTSVGVFAEGSLMHVDAVAVGSHHVTMDIARGLTTRLVDAERLKTLYGSCMTATSDEREMIDVAPLGDEGDHPHHAPKSHLTRIIKPRVEEILELVRDRLKAAGFTSHAGRRLVLTGGGSQLTGIADLARSIISQQVRVGRPVGIQGLPESAKNPAFAVAIGLLVYPQVAGIEHFEPRRQQTAPTVPVQRGYASRVGRWLKESF